MTNHISTVTKSCFFHLRRISQVKRCLNEKCLRTLVQALVISRLDYCNSILINLPDTTLHPYTTILHSAARLVNSLKPRDHITPALQQLHWLPIKARISFKICVLMFNIHSGSCPCYMTSLVTPCTTVESRSSLRSSTTQRTSSSFSRRVLIELSDKIAKAIEDKKFMMGIFIDLSKAFDTPKPFYIITKTDELRNKRHFK